MKKIKKTCFAELYPTDPAKVINHKQSSLMMINDDYKRFGVLTWT